MNSKTIAIIGSHPVTRKDFDWNRTDCEIWVFNEALSTEWFQRADAVFQMHEPAIWKNPLNRNDPKHYEWLTQDHGDMLIYMMDKYEDVPNSVKYPLEEVCSSLLPNFNDGLKFFTSSPAFALALAIMNNATRIEMYGVEMETDTEYRYQRDCIAFWIGIAVGRGIDVYTNSRIFQNPVYGYEGKISVEYSEFDERIKELEPQCAQIQAMFDKQGEEAKALFEGFLKKENDGKELTTSVQKMVVLASHFGFMDGARQENLRYKKKADTMIEASGGFLIVRQEFEQAAVALVKTKQEYVMKSSALAGRLQGIFEQIEKIQNIKRRINHSDEFVSTLNDYVKMSTMVGMCSGGADENRRYYNKLDKFAKAAGGSKSELVMMESFGKTE